MYNDYPESKGTLACSPVQESQRQRLEREKKHLTARITDIDRALDLLAKHPEMEELTDLLRRL